jgi:hypothetical protein
MVRVRKRSLLAPGNFPRGVSSCLGMKSNEIFPFLYCEPKESVGKKSFESWIL